MFSRLFGNYLIRNNIINAEQLNEELKQQKASRVKLGLIAVSEKLLTEQQADEVNKLQRIMDKKFGDIAIEKGYLTESQVRRLLYLQGNPYLIFVQFFIEKNILSLNDIEVYLSAYQKENSLTDTDMEALKNGDIDNIIPIFVHTESPFYLDLISLAVRSLIRFVDNDIFIEPIYSVNEYNFETLAFQRLVGKHDMFVGLAAKDKDLLIIANPYAKEDFTEMNEDSFDAVCEFINCINGLFATRLSQGNIDIEMVPPQYFVNQTLFSKEQITVIPIIINGKKIDFLLSIDNIVNVK
jgi:hypothetical protein